MLLLTDFFREEDESWRIGIKLPCHIRIDLDRGYRVVEFAEDEPWYPHHHGGGRHLKNGPQGPRGKKPAKAKHGGGRGKGRNR